jgi:hypothetical protein
MLAELAKIRSELAGDLLDKSLLKMIYKPSALEGHISDFMSSSMQEEESIGDERNPNMDQSINNVSQTISTNLIVPAPQHQRGDTILSSEETDEKRSYTPQPR